MARSRGAVSRAASALLFVCAALAVVVFPEGEAGGVAANVGFAPVQIPVYDRENGITNEQLDDPRLCQELGGTPDSNNPRICSGVDVSDTFCLMGAEDDSGNAFHCRGLFRHVIQCNDEFDRPAINPFLCGFACAPDDNALGSACQRAFAPDEILPLDEHERAITTAEGFYGTIATLGVRDAPPTERSTHGVLFLNVYRPNENNFTVSVNRDANFRSILQIPESAPVGPVQESRSVTVIMSCQGNESNDNDPNRHCFPTMLTLSADITVIARPDQIGGGVEVGDEISLVSFIVPDAPHDGGTFNLAAIREVGEPPLTADPLPFSIAASGGAVGGSSANAGAFVLLADYDADSFFGSMRLSLTVRVTFGTIQEIPESEWGVPQEDRSVTLLVAAGHNGAIFTITSRNASGRVRAPEENPAGLALQEQGRGVEMRLDPPLVSDGLAETNVEVTVEHRSVPESFETLAQTVAVSVAIVTAPEQLDGIVAEIGHQLEYPFEGPGGFPGLLSNPNFSGVPGSPFAVDGDGNASGVVPADTNPDDLITVRALWTADGMIGALTLEVILTAQIRQVDVDLDLVVAEQDRVVTLNTAVGYQGAGYRIPIVSPDEYSLANPRYDETSHGYDEGESAILITSPVAEGVTLEATVVADVECSPDTIPPRKCNPATLGVTVVFAPVAASAPGSSEYRYGDQIGFAFDNIPAFLRASEGFDLTIVGINGYEGDVSQFNIRHDRGAQGFVLNRTADPDLPAGNYTLTAAATSPILLGTLYAERLLEFSRGELGVDYALSDLNPDVVTVAENYRGEVHRLALGENIVDATILSPETTPDQLTLTFSDDRRSVFVSLNPDYFSWVGGSELNAEVTLVVDRDGNLRRESVLNLRVSALADVTASARDVIPYAPNENIHDFGVGVYENAVFALDNANEELSISAEGIISAPASITVAGLYEFAATATAAAFLGIARFEFGLNLEDGSSVPSNSSIPFAERDFSALVVAGYRGSVAFFAAAEEGVTLQTPADSPSGFNFGEDGNGRDFVSPDGFTLFLTAEGSEGAVAAVSLTARASGFEPTELLLSVSVAAIGLPSQPVLSALNTVGLFDYAFTLPPSFDNDDASFVLAAGTECFRIAGGQLQPDDTDSNCAAQRIGEYNVTVVATHDGFLGEMRLIVPVDIEVALDPADIADADHAQPVAVGDIGERRYEIPVLDDRYSISVSVLTDGFAVEESSIVVFEGAMPNADVPVTLDVSATCADSAENCVLLDFRATVLFTPVDAPLAEARVNSETYESGNAFDFGGANYEGGAYENAAFTRLGDSDSLSISADGVVGTGRELGRGTYAITARAEDAEHPRDFLGIAEMTLSLTVAGELRRANHDDLIANRLPTLRVATRHAGDIYTVPEIPGDSVYALVYGDASGGELDFDAATRIVSIPDGDAMGGANRSVALTANINCPANQDLNDSAYVNCPAGQQLTITVVALPVEDADPVNEIEATYGDADFSAAIPVPSGLDADDLQFVLAGAIPADSADQFGISGASVIFNGESYPDAGNYTLSVDVSHSDGDGVSGFVGTLLSEISVEIIPAALPDVYGLSDDVLNPPEILVADGYDGEVYRISLRAEDGVLVLPDSQPVGFSLALSDDARAALFYHDPALSGGRRLEGRADVIVTLNSNYLTRAETAMLTIVALENVAVQESGGAPYPVSVVHDFGVGDFDGAVFAAVAGGDEELAIGADGEVSTAEEIGAIGTYYLTATATASAFLGTVRFELALVVEDASVVRARDSIPLERRELRQPVAAGYSGSVAFYAAEREGVTLQTPTDQPPGFNFGGGAGQSFVGGESGFTLFTDAAAVGGESQVAEFVVTASFGNLEDTDISLIVSVVALEAPQQNTLTVRRATGENNNEDNMYFPHSFILPAGFDADDGTYATASDNFQIANGDLRFVNFASFGDERTAVVEVSHPDFLGTMELSVPVNLQEELNPDNVVADRTPTVAVATGALGGQEYTIFVLNQRYELQNFRYDDGARSSIRAADNAIVFSADAELLGGFDAELTAEVVCSSQFDNCAPLEITMTIAFEQVSAPNQPLIVRTYDEFTADTAASFALPAGYGQNSTFRDDIGQYYAEGPAAEYENDPARPGGGFVLSGGGGNSLFDGESGIPEVRVIPHPIPGNDPIVIAPPDHPAKSVGRYIVTLGITDPGFWGELILEIPIRIIPASFENDADYAISAPDAPIAVATTYTGELHQTSIASTVAATVIGHGALRNPDGLPPQFSSSISDDSRTVIFSLASAPTSGEVALTATVVVTRGHNYEDWEQIYKLTISAVSPPDQTPINVEFGKFGSDNRGTLTLPTGFASGAAVTIAGISGTGGNFSLTPDDSGIFIHDNNPTGNPSSAGEYVVTVAMTHSGFRGRLLLEIPINIARADLANPDNYLLGGLAGDAIVLAPSYVGPVYESGITPTDARVSLPADIPERYRIDASADGRNVTVHLLSPIADGTEATDVFEFAIVPDNANINPLSQLLTLLISARVAVPEIPAVRDAADTFANGGEVFNLAGASFAGGIFAGDTFSQVGDSTDLTLAASGVVSAARELEAGLYVLTARATSNGYKGAHLFTVRLAVGELRADAESTLPPEVYPRTVRAALSHRGAIAAYPASGDIVNGFTLSYSAPEGGQLAVDPASGIVSIPGEEEMGDAVRRATLTIAAGCHNPDGDLPPCAPDQAPLTVGIAAVPVSNIALVTLDAYVYRGKTQNDISHSIPAPSGFESATLRFTIVGLASDAPGVSAANFTLNGATLQADVSDEDGRGAPDLGIHQLTVGIYSAEDPPAFRGTVFAPIRVPVLETLPPPPLASPIYFGATQINALRQSAPLPGSGPEVSMYYYAGERRGMHVMILIGGDQHDNEVSANFCDSADNSAQGADWRPPNLYEGAALVIDEQSPVLAIDNEFNMIGFGAHNTEGIALSFADGDIDVGPPPALRWENNGVGLATDDDATRNLALVRVGVYSPPNRDQFFVGADANQPRVFAPDHDIDIGSALAAEINLVKAVCVLESDNYQHYDYPELAAVEVESGGETAVGVVLNSFNGGESEYAESIDAPARTSAGPLLTMTAYARHYPDGSQANLPNEAVSVGFAASVDENVFGLTHREITAGEPGVREVVVNLKTDITEQKSAVVLFAPVLGQTVSLTINTQTEERFLVQFSEHPPDFDRASSGDAGGFGVVEAASDSAFGNAIEDGAEGGAVGSTVYFRATPSTVDVYVDFWLIVNNGVTATFRFNTDSLPDDVVSCEVGGPSDAYADENSTGAKVCQIAARGDISVRARYRRDVLDAQDIEDLCAPSALAGDKNSASVFAEVARNTNSNSLIDPRVGRFCVFNVDRSDTNPSRASAAMNLHLPNNPAYDPAVPMATRCDFDGIVFDAPPVDINDINKMNAACVAGVVEGAGTGLFVSDSGYAQPGSSCEVGSEPKCGLICNDGFEDVTLEASKVDCRASQEGRDPKTCFAPGLLYDAGIHKNVRVGVINAGAGNVWSQDVDVSRILCRDVHSFTCPGSQVKAVAGNPLSECVDP